MSNAEQSGAKSIDRRHFLAGVGAATAAGLAGCLDGGGSGDLGESVPTITIEYWSNVTTSTSFSEDALPVIKKNLEKELGVTVEIRPLELASALRSLVNDERSANMQMYWFPSTPDRLDPHVWTVRFGVDYAGGNGRPSPNQYTDCEFTTAAKQQTAVNDQEKRRQLVYSAHERMSNAVGTIPLMPSADVAGYRTSAIDLKGLGDRPLSFLNIPSFVESAAKNDDNTITTTSSPTALQTTNYPVHNSFALMGMWNHGIHSSLLEYDGEYNRINALAKEYTVSDDATEVVVTLREGTFHNGDPITAEDVKFTYEHLAGNPGVFPKAPTAPFDTITAVDEKTVEFTFTRPYIPFVTKDMPLWGIMHKQSWVDAGAKEDPGGVQLDPIIGSGPFEVDNFTKGQLIKLVPFDGHPLWTPNSSVVEKAYRDATSSFQAFQAGEVDAVGLSGAQADKVEGESDVTIYDGQSFMNQFLAPQLNFGPTKFLEFRKAVGAVIDREKINQLAYLGRADPDLYSAPCHSTHEWRPPEEMLYKMTDEMNGDPEAAKKFLEDAGWGWDGADNLHYPPDADLSPQWPQGETPDYSEFPCVNEEGRYIPQSER